MGEYLMRRRRRKTMMRTWCCRTIVHRLSRGVVISLKNTDTYKVMLISSLPYPTRVYPRHSVCMSSVNVDAVLLITAAQLRAVVIVPPCLSPPRPPVVDRWWVGSLGGSTLDSTWQRGVGSRQCTLRLRESREDGEAVADHRFRAPPSVQTSPSPSLSCPRRHSREARAISPGVASLTAVTSRLFSASSLVVTLPLLTRRTPVSSRVSRYCRRYLRVVAPSE